MGSEADVVIIGAGPAGLALALSMARRGRRVKVLERDPPQPLGDPRDAYSTWSRPSVPQTLQPHSLLARTRRALRLHAPDVLAELLRAGAWENDLRARLVKDAAQAGDEDLVAVHVRRPVFECVLRQAAAREPLLDIMSGVVATGIQLDMPLGQPPKVSGVMVDGATIDASVVVDAGGRRSPVRGWLKNAGISLAPPRVEECGVIYYSRYFRLRAGVDYPKWVGVLGPAGITDCSRFSTFFGDNGTFAIVLGVPGWEHAFRALAHNQAFMNVIARFRSLAPFVSDEVSEPITNVMPFGALQNVFHSPLRDGQVPALGLHFIGDAYCHTNPLFAWGLCLGVDYGFALGKIIDEHPTDLEAQGLAFAELSQIEAEQCYLAVAAEDRDRGLTWRGDQPSGPWLGRTFAGFVRQCAGPAVMVDGDVARHVLRRANLLDLPDDLKYQQEIIERVAVLQSDLPKPPPGASPTREEVLELLSTQAGS